MDSYSEHLRKHFEQLHTEELIRLHSSGTLTDVAYEVIEAEMMKRSIDVPKRSASIEETYKPVNLFQAYWKGEKPLWSAWWLIGVLGIHLALGTAFVIAYMFISIPGSNRIEFEQMSMFFGVVLTLFTPYFLFACVSVWMCAGNTEWKWCGPLARLCIIAISLYFLMIVTGKV